MCFIFYMYRLQCSFLELNIQGSTLYFSRLNLCDSFRYIIVANPYPEVSSDFYFIIATNAKSICKMETWVSLGYRYWNLSFFSLTFASPLLTGTVITENSHALCAGNVHNYQLVESRKLPDNFLVSSLSEVMFYFLQLARFTVWNNSFRWLLSQRTWKWLRVYQSFMITLPIRQSNRGVF